MKYRVLQRAVTTLAAIAVAALLVVPRAALSAPPVRREKQHTTPVLFPVTGLHVALPVGWKVEASGLGDEAYDLLNHSGSPDPGFQIWIGYWHGNLTDSCTDSFAARKEDARAATYLPRSWFPKVLPSQSCHGAPYYFASEGQCFENACVQKDNVSLWAMIEITSAKPDLTQLRHVLERVGRAFLTARAAGGSSSEPAPSRE